MIINERVTHTMVLVVNMLSFKSHQVKIGNVKYDMPNPNKRAVHASLVLSMIMRVAYQKHMLAGTP